MSARRMPSPLMANNRRRAAYGRSRATRRAPPGEDEDADEDGCLAAKRRRRLPPVETLPRKRRDGQDKCNAVPSAKAPTELVKPRTKKEGKTCQQKVPKQRFRDPLPMKMRALPQSFWQQPNLAPSSAPGGSVCALPPLPLPILLEKVSANDQASKGSEGAVAAVGGAVREREELVSAANTDLLFSLFRGVERVAAEAQRGGRALSGAEEEASGGGGGRGEEDGAPRRPAPVRRGRPRKATTWPAASAAGGASGGGVRDDDPCMVSAVADSIRPLLPSAKDSKDGPQVLAMVTLPEVGGDVSLPTLDVQHNYSQILSKLVMKL